jgi:hypothetical protein
MPLTTSDAGAAKSGAKRLLAVRTETRERTSLASTGDTAPSARSMRVAHTELHHTAIRPHTKHRKWRGGGKSTQETAPDKGKRGGGKRNAPETPKMNPASALAITSMFAVSDAMPVALPACRPPQGATAQLDSVSAGMECALKLHIQADAVSGRQFIPREDRPRYDSRVQDTTEYHRHRTVRHMQPGSRQHHQRERTGSARPC